MTKESLSRIMEALAAHNVRFLVVGGLAVNAHGLLRFTADVDLVVQLVPDNVRRAFTALGSIGFQPNVPVTAEDFADANTRQGWIRDKGMRVLQFRSDEHKTVTVDIFVSEPFPFDIEYEQSLIRGLAGGIEVRFISLTTLLQMKKEAGRPQDLLDLNQLNHLVKDDEPRT